MGIRGLGLLGSLLSALAVGACEIILPVKDKAPQPNPPTGTPCPSLDASFSNSKFCDDFETGDFLHWSSPASSVCMGSTIDVYGVDAGPPAPYGGSYAARVTVPAGDGCGAVIRKDLTVPSPPATVAVRVYMNAYVAPPNSNADFMILQIPPSTWHLTEVLQTSNDLWAVDVHRAMSDGMQHVSTVSGPPTADGGTWFCLEWDVLFANGPGHVKLFVSGAPVVDVDDDTLGDAGTVPSSFALGIPSGGVVGSPFDIRYDDLVVAAFEGGSVSAGPLIGCE